MSSAGWRARHVAPRVEYRAGRALAAIVSGIGWLAIGMALLTLAVGMTAELAPVPALQEFKLAYFHGGRFKQLSQVGGQVISELIA